MRQLIHNGILVPRYESKRLHIFIKGAKMELTPKQEEMAVGWVKKLGTAYVEDEVFVKNFFKDFYEALNMKGDLRREDFDFSAIQEHIEREKAAKLGLSREENKQLAEQRKTLKEANKEKYGYATIDGTKNMISNYMAEPSCIFMGRGKHPLRGRWKEGPREEDIELNLSPDAPRPLGNWKAVEWQPDTMWIARWKDKLSSKTKYVWLSDDSALKQKKDIEKFNKAMELQRNLAKIQRHILENLEAEDLRRRKTAIVCFLIDKLKIRVGDEKDPDEADTVGASTLRPEHIRFDADGYVTFNFLGKDSVPHVFKVELPEKVVRNLKEFSASAESNLFDGVNSERVSDFLDEVISGLSAKVFRTCYASEVVEKKLKNASVKTEAPDYVKKYVATMANLEAAKVCNHRRTIPKTWESSLQKKEARLKEWAEKARATLDRARQKAKEKEEWYIERLRIEEEKLKTMRDKLETYRRQGEERKQQGKPVKSLKRRCSLQLETVKRQERKLQGLKGRYAEQVRKMKEKLEKQGQRDKAMLEGMGLRIRGEKATRDYNLRTSLKSYIDPRIYYSWGKEVDYDWKLYYPKTLQNKFSWAEKSQDQSST